MAFAGYAADSQHEKLRAALAFHASFDGGAKADFAQADPQLYHASSMSKRSDAKAGLPSDDAVAPAKQQGKFGDALQFKRKKAPLIFFKADKNVPYASRDWSGTVSFWLSVDPRDELEMGFCDPVQITPRAWNDAAFFVEFEKRKEDIPFRLGAYADYKIWNPAGRKWEQIPFSEKPLVTVDQPPFARGKWTHVVFTWDDFNSGKPDGVAKLYLDGKQRGTLSAREQTFTWDPVHTSMMLGVGYIGLFDELSVFNRALTAAEIETLHRLPNGVKALLKQ
jgi:hypothetical protein